MVPFSKNDHSVLPSDWVHEQYLDYGPLFAPIRHKCWVLTPHAVSVTDGDARANVFRTDDGIVVPVTFGGTDEVTVALDDIYDIEGGVESAEIRYPGADDWRSIKASRADDQRVSFTIPLERGCGVVRIRPG